MTERDENAVFNSASDLGRYTPIKQESGVLPESAIVGMFTNGVVSDDVRNRRRVDERSSEFFTPEQLKKLKGFSGEITSLVSRLTHSGAITQVGDVVKVSEKFIDIIDDATVASLAFVNKHLDYAVNANPSLQYDLKLESQRASEVAGQFQEHAANLTVKLEETRARLAAYEGETLSGEQKKHLLDQLVVVKDISAEVAAFGRAYQAVAAADVKTIAGDHKGAQEVMARLGLRQKEGGRGIAGPTAKPE